MSSLTMELDDAELRRYQRQINLKGWDLEGQERLKASTVLVIGLGGLGCAAAFVVSDRVVQ